MRTTTSAMRATSTAPVACANATTTDSTTIPMTSSMTAAPRIVDPSRDLRTPSSISVCAEMLTLVAVRMVPTKSPSQNTGRPNADAIAMPPAIGSTTPPAADQNATWPTRRSSARSVSRPATNISRTTPTSARSWTIAMSDGPSAPGANARHPSTSSAVGPSTRPARISPKTAGWPSRLAAAPASLADVITSARSSSNCSRWDMAAPLKCCTGGAAAARRPLLAAS